MNTQTDTRTSYLTHSYSSQAVFALCVGIFIGFLAPFGMHAVPLWISISYWSVTYVLGYVVFAPMTHLGEKYLSQRIHLYWLNNFCMVISLLSLLKQGYQQQRQLLTLTQEDKNTIEQQLQIAPLADSQLQAFMTLLPIEK